MNCYNDVCNSLASQCMQSAGHGDPRTKFDLAQAKKRMRALSSPAGSSGLSRLLEPLRHLPKPRYRFPDTGSGGYLPQQSKEGGRGCFF